jgi:hypothetical protein
MEKGVEESFDSEQVVTIIVDRRAAVNAASGACERFPTPLPAGRRYPI